MQQEDAFDLLHEVEAIPDPVSKEGVCSYFISISYVEGGEAKTVEKTGYNTFPDNWDKIVESANKVYGSDRINNSKEVAVIDAEYLSKHHLFNDYWIIPADMTLDDIIADIPITYQFIYDPRPSTYLQDYRVEETIKDYLYDYYDLQSHQIDKLDKDPAKSSAAELKDFADSRLDSVDWDKATEYSCTGSYLGVDYEIVRYDMVQTWLDSQKTYANTTIEKCGFDGPNCQYQIVLPPWEFGASRQVITKEVFVDGSGKYLILTDRAIPDNLAAVFE